MTALVSDSDPPRAPRTTAGTPSVDEPIPVLPVRSSGADYDEEFTAFVTGAQSELGKTAWLLTGDAHLATELVQDALVRTYVAWPRARASDPLAYARRVLANSRIDMWRRRRRELLREPASLPDRARHSDTLVIEHRDELVRALAALSTRQRRVVVLRYLIGMSEREVAADLDMSLGIVKSHAFRGLKVLRANLSTLDDEGGKP